MIPKLQSLEARTIRSLRLAIAATFILLIASASIVLQQPAAQAANEPLIRICLPLINNGDLVEDYGYFTFRIELEANGQFAGTLSAGAEEGDFPCHDIPLLNVNVPAGTQVVVEITEYSDGWKNAAGYPQYSIGQGLVAGDSVTFAFNGVSQTVYFYLQHAYNADLQVCNGIEDNGDMVVDSGTWMYSLAVQGQQPFLTESVSATEGQEENCLFVLLRDYGLAAPVNIVITELANPGFVDQAGYPRWQNFAADESGTGSSMTLSFGANTNQRHGYFFHKSVMYQPTPTPADPTPAPTEPVPPMAGEPTLTPCPAPVDEPTDNEPVGEGPGDDEPVPGEPTDDGSDQPATGPEGDAPADGETPLPAEPEGDNGGALPIEEDETTAPAPAAPVATPSAPNTGSAGLAAERGSPLPLAIALVIAGISGAGAVMAVSKRR